MSQTLKSDTKSENEKSQAPKAVDLSTPILEPGLYVIATPIGNLRDITLRALETLAGVDLVLAEDTRTSAKLMHAFGLNVKLSAYHDHNAAKRVPNLVKSLLAGKSMALISDAGTPLVSDPGHKLVRACIENEINIVPVPGASAVLAAMMSSGLMSERFLFGGFLPPKSTARQTVLQEFAELRAALVFFETAPRLYESLRDILSCLGNRKIAICRELTKKYEQILRGDLQTLIPTLEHTQLRGEIVLVIEAPKTRKIWSKQDVEEALKKRIGALGVKRASTEIAALSGHKKRDVYQWALDLER